MGDVCVTVPQRLWLDWLAEGDLPGQVAEYESHFWLPRPLPTIAPGERVYIVAWGRLRGYAPLVRVEPRCKLRPTVGCLVRSDGAQAVTLPAPIRGFQGWRYRFWPREAEIVFPTWQTEGVGTCVKSQLALI